MKSITRKAIYDLVKRAVDKKLASYEPESSNMPFADAMFGKEAVMTASILQSFYTTFGMSTYEQMAILLAKDAGYAAEHQYKLLGTVNTPTAVIIDKLSRSGVQPDTLSALKAIQKTIVPGKALNDRDSVVDVFIRKPSGEELYIDIITVKANKKEFQALREKLLRWYALRLSQGKPKTIRCCLGIPYNPYHPKPYTRWTGACCDPSRDLLVQEQFWSAVGGEGSFEDLLAIFKEVGREVESEVDAFFSRQRDKRRN